MTDARDRGQTGNVGHGGHRPVSGNTAIRVLVVDDHPIVREGITSLLESQPDMTVVGEAGDGGEAIDLFRSLCPDVTLMDIQMPGVNGTQAIATIRAEALRRSSWSSRHMRVTHRQPARSRRVPPDIWSRAASARN